jgi:FG-GAP repeat
VFVRNDATWTAGQKLIALIRGGDKEIGGGNFGSSVALSSDGNTALVGAPFDKPITPSFFPAGVGTASVFSRKGTTWINQHTLLAPTSGADMEIGPGNFGTSVALSSDGNTALVGGPGDNPNRGCDSNWTIMERVP